MPPGEATMSKEDSARYKDLFSKLDVNKDGIVEVGELAKVMRAQKNLKESDVEGQAKVKAEAEYYQTISQSQQEQYLHQFGFKLCLLTNYEYRSYKYKASEGCFGSPLSIHIQLLVKVFRQMKQE
ncbi:hypothetical protein CAPTEDRAFT_211764 [Capitella teleta]|uniref:EF-hand domain-containing protein n=1 Tax=Capitella teleta TaxID=283909 RepID=R7T9S3_CAPTE|nr:hypothetical protein CAPTEDRAFT_211764 [Capitella teleta]|eukprot:ELT87744.1 hypothetical protein CAPTEDRAFT_211764 [Capitella teleta]